LRELEEETGYVAERILKLPSRPIHCDPWKSNEAGFLYIGIINGDDLNHKK
jgi:8-oxo-dGTP pyrophosphatase MutT (NUDIX family)